MNGKIVSRRAFLQTAAAVSASPALGALGANERIRIGFIGAGGRATRHYSLFLDKHKDAEIVAIADVDPVRLGQAAEAIKTAKPYQDFRHVIDNKDIDAVFVCPPGHWHTIPAVMAMQAGKDVYVEKPTGHTIHEGRLLVEAAKKYNRIFQTGTQQRSGPHWINARKRVQAGEIGQVTNVNVCNYWNWWIKVSGKSLNQPDGDPPPGLITTCGWGRHPSGPSIPRDGTTIFTSFMIIQEA